MNQEPLVGRDVTLHVYLVLAVNGDVVLLAVVAAFVVLCILAALILKELNKHR